MWQYVSNLSLSMTFFKCLSSSDNFSLYRHRNLCINCTKQEYIIITKAITKQTKIIHLSTNFSLYNTIKNSVDFEYHIDSENKYIGVNMSHNTLIKGLTP